MDTSKEYIKMCEKAVEIQKLFIRGRVWSYLENFLFHDTTQLKDKEVWLPRQDQLQEMVLNLGQHGYSNEGILQHLSMFSYENSLNEVSMEQLWLAFVMSERYLKVWSGTDWIKK